MCTPLHTRIEATVHAEDRNYCFRSKEGKDGAACEKSHSIHCLRFETNSVD